MEVGDRAPAGRVITFYSYKGGTGRSMALANIAYLLCQDRSKRGRPTATGRVLAIDWDLEAPGLHRYFAALRPDDDDPLEDGLIELFTELGQRAGVRQPATTAADDDALADTLVRDLDLQRYLKKTQVPGLWFIPAGRLDASYSTRVTRFDWRALHRRLPTLITAFSRRLAAEYEYVLIDSRTGISDTSGICTMVMPDLLVAVFTPNLQSIAGLLDVVREAATFRGQSSDLRPLMVFPVPSRIESARPSLLELWRNGVRGYQPEFEKLLGSVYGLPECDLSQYFDEVQIQHVPDYAYGEQIAVAVEDTDSRLSLRRSYESVASWLVDTGAPWLDPRIVESERHIRKLCEQTQTALDREQLDEARALLARAADEPRAARGNVAPVLCETLARLGDELAKASLFAASEEAFRRAAELAVQEADTRESAALEAVGYLERLADVLAGLGRPSEAKTVLREVVTRREDVLGDTHISVADAYEKLGVVLGELGELTAGIEALQHGLEIRVSAVGEADPSIAISLQRLAVTALRAGDTARSEQYLRRALDLTPDTWVRKRGQILQQLGELRLHVGECESAQEFFESAIASVVSADPQSSVIVADSYDGLGRVALEQGAVEVARDHFEHAQALREEALGPHHPATLITPLNLGDVARAEGDVTRAERQYSRVVSQAHRSAGNDPFAVEALRRLADVAASRGDLEGARVRLEQALRIDERRGNQAAAAADHHRLGALAWEQGDYETAEARYLQSLQINEDLRNQSAVARNQQELEMVARELLPTERRHYEGTERRDVQVLETEPAALARAYRQLGAAARERWDYEGAERCLRRSLVISERRGDEAAVADVALELGAVARERGDYAGAERYLRRSVQVSEHLGDDGAAAVGYQELASVAALRDDDNAAEQHYLRSVELDRQLGNDARVAGSYARLAALRTLRGPDAKAAKYELQALSVWLRTSSLHASASLRRLGSIRSRLGDDAFTSIVHRHTPDAGLRHLIDTRTAKKAVATSAGDTASAP